MSNDLFNAMEEQMVAVKGFFEKLKINDKPVTVERLDKAPTDMVCVQIGGCIHIYPEVVSVDVGLLRGKVKQDQMRWFVDHMVYYAGDYDTPPEADAELITGEEGVRGFGEALAIAAAELMRMEVENYFSSMPEPDIEYPKEFGDNFIGDEIPMDDDQFEAMCRESDFQYDANREKRSL